MKSIAVRLCILGLIVFSQLSFAAIDPRLVGVWRSNDSLKFRLEFKADSTMTIWLEKKKGGFGPLSRILQIKDRNKPIFMLENQHFQIGKGEKAGYFHYEVTLKNPDAPLEQHKYKLEFYQVNKDLLKIDRNELSNNQSSQLNLNAIKFVYNKVNFKDPAQIRVIGDYQTHKNLALESLLQAAIMIKDTKAINRLLSSKKAAILTASETKKSIKQGRNMLRIRLWDAAANTYDIEVISAFYRGLPDGYSASYLQGAMKAKKEGIVELYKRLTGAIVSGLSETEKNQLQFVLNTHGKLSNYALTPEHLISETFGCREASIDYSAVNRMKMGEIKPDSETQARLDWGEALLKKMRKEWSLYVSLVEAEFRYCLQHGSNSGSISSKIINARTTPGDRISYSTTPLYYYSKMKQQGNARNSLSESAVRYAVMDVLLSLGADPNIKPTEDAMSLADHMFVYADHIAFHQALNSSRPKEHPMMANIKKYNEVMKKIGGSEYDMKVDARDVYEKHTTLVASGAFPHSTQDNEGSVAEQTSLIKPESKTKTTKSITANQVKTTRIAVSNQPQVEKNAPTPVPYKMQTYWHAKVVTVDPDMPLDPAIRSMWTKGMYLHFRKDGSVGFNTEVPGPYLHLPVNKWQKKLGAFTLTLTDISYTFTLPKIASEKSLTTLDNQSKQFKMTLRKIKPDTE